MKHPVLGVLFLFPTLSIHAHQLDGNLGDPNRPFANQSRQSDQSSDSAHLADVLTQLRQRMQKAGPPSNETILAASKILNADHPWYCDPKTKTFRHLSHELIEHLNRRPDIKRELREFDPAQISAHFKEALAKSPKERIAALNHPALLLTDEEASVNALEILAGYYIDRDEPILASVYMNRILEIRTLDELPLATVLKAGLIYTSTWNLNRVKTIALELNQRIAQTQLSDENRKKIDQVINASLPQAVRPLWRKPSIETTLGRLIQDGRLETFSEILRILPPDQLNLEETVKCDLPLIATKKFHENLTVREVSASLDAVRALGLEDFPESIRARLMPRVERELDSASDALRFFQQEPGFHGIVRDEEREAVNRLGSYGTLGATRLAHALRTSHQHNSAAKNLIIDTLGRMGHEATPAIPTLIDNLNSANVSGAAIKALGSMGPKAKDAVPALTRHVRFSNHYRVRELAIDAIQQIGVADKDTLAALRFVFETDGSEYAKKASIDCLVSLTSGTPDASQTAQFLRQILGSSGWKHYHGFVRQQLTQLRIPDSP